MADTDVLIKDLPLTETVNDSDDLVTEDSSPTTHRIKASVVKNYINAEQNEELDGLKVDLDNVNSNIGSLSSKVDDATTTVSSMQTNLNSMDGRVQANADNISTLNSALADKADESRLNFDMYNSLGNIGLSVSTATSLLAITQAMNSKSTSCILFMTVNSSDTSTLYSNGIIPRNYTGTLEILFRSRARAMFTADDGNTYVCATSNGTTSDFTSWSQL